MRHPVGAVREPPLLPFTPSVHSEFRVGRRVFVLVGQALLPVPVPHSQEWLCHQSD